MSDDFYRKFEDVHRGSRELIKSRLAVYLPFVEPLLKFYPNSSTIDLGCGRGEWLETLDTIGFQSQGVDLDTGMLRVCCELGLNVVEGDALPYLANLASESQAIVSAFHVVEHIKFEQLRLLVKEALRVLKPGGLLIMETPNPENIVVATRNFYLDPTHQRPIPSTLLAFVAEFSGFHRVKTLRLQESTELVNRYDVSLLDVFSGASPDYAVVAQKHASDNVLSSTSNAFSVDFGLSLNDLLSRYDSRFNRIEATVQQAETKAQKAEAKAQQAETKADQAELKARRCEEALDAMHNSFSWRLTVPVRMIGHKVRSLQKYLIMKKLMCKNKITLLLAHARLYINRRPKLRELILGSAKLNLIRAWIIKKYPGLRVQFNNSGEIGSGQFVPQSFDGLTSVRIMLSLDELIKKSETVDSVLFLEVTNGK